MWNIAPIALLETIFRSGFVYLSILALMRLSGKRHVAQLSIVDFVLVLLISNAVQNAMVGPDTSVSGGLVAAGTLLVVNLALTRLLLRYERLGSFLEGEPTLLIRDGRYLEANMAREGVRRGEVLAAIREHGMDDETHVRQAILELDGSISVLAFGGRSDEQRLPPLRRRRHAPGKQPRSAPP